MTPRIAAPQMPPSDAAEPHTPTRTRTMRPATSALTAAQRTEVVESPTLGPRLLGPIAAAGLLGYSASELVQAVNAGTVPAFRIGDHLRFKPDDLQALTGGTWPPVEIG